MAAVTSWPRSRSRSATLPLVCSSRRSFTPKRPLRASRLLRLHGVFGVEGDPTVDLVGEGAVVADRGPHLGIGEVEDLGSGGDRLLPTRLAALERGHALPDVRTTGRGAGPRWWRPPHGRARPTIASSASTVAGRHAGGDRARLIPPSAGPASLVRRPSAVRREKIPRHRALRVAAFPRPSSPGSSSRRAAGRQRAGRRSGSPSDCR